MKQNKISKKTFSTKVKCISNQVTPISITRVKNRKWLATKFYEIQYGYFFVICQQLQTSTSGYALIDWINYLVRFLTTLITIIQL